MILYYTAEGRVNLERLALLATRLRVQEVSTQGFATPMRVGVKIMVRFWGPQNTRYIETIVNLSKSWFW